MRISLKVAAMLALAGFFAACHKDDTTIAPPRDFAVQYGVEKAEIEQYMQTHYMTVDADYNVTFDTIINNNHVSIWDQTDYPKKKKLVTSNSVTYDVWYIVINPGVGQAPTRADEALVSYRGTLLDGTQFDYLPYPQNYSSLLSTIEGWQEIIPLFRGGQYVDTNGADPASFQNYGAGVMFLPSGLGYYNLATANAPSYSSMIFTFKMYDQKSMDTDGDGILNKYETVSSTDLETYPMGYVDLNHYDTDGDGTPNYKDTDDDNDGYPTLREIKRPVGIDTDGDGVLDSFYYDYNAPQIMCGTVPNYLSTECVAPNE